MSRLFASTCASRTVVGWCAIVGDAVSEIPSGRLLQETGGLPTANLLRQAVAFGIRGDWAPLPDRLRSCRAMREKLSNLASLLLAIPW